MDSHQQLIFALYDIGAIQFGEYKLKSGEMTSIYINLRKIISYPDILRLVANLMWREVATTKFDMVCGVPYTALPIATCLSLTHDIPMIMRRKEKKDYGTKQSIEGVFQPQQTCLIIEDVVTSGSSILETVHDLEDVGLQVKDIVALLDREQGGKENLEKKYRFHSVLKFKPLLETLLQSDKLAPTEKTHIQTYLATNSL